MTTWTEEGTERLLDYVAATLDAHEDGPRTAEVQGAVEILQTFYDNGDQFPEFWLPSPTAIEFLWDYRLSGYEFSRTLIDEAPETALSISMALAPVKLLLDRITN